MHYAVGAQQQLSSIQRLGVKGRLSDSLRMGKKVKLTTKGQKDYLFSALMGT